MNRRTVASLVLIAIAASGVAWWTLSIGRDPRAEAEAAARRGDWAEVISKTDRALATRPDDSAMRLLRARGLARSGQGVEGLSAYKDAGAEAIAGEDLRPLADLLLAKDRPALAWLALEAAGRIDPDDAETRAAMTRLHARIGSRGDVAHATDKLSAVPGGPALAEIVLQLAAIARRDRDDDPMFDRFLARDRATLKAIDGPRAARRLAARVLLEAGRISEAREALERLLASGPDREASWLLSRALLHDGEADAADAALAASAGFARDRRADHEPAPYAGAASCRACHSEIYESQQHGRHATTIRHGDELATVAIPDAPLADPVDPEVSHHFTRAPHAIHLETTVGDRASLAVLDYALGSGHRGVTLMGKDSEGTYREPRISEYSETGTTWDVTSGFNPHPANPAEYLGQAVSPSGFRDCLNCHMTRFRAVEERPGPEALDRGIGCERCHGPAGNHERAVASGFAEPAIGRPKGATGAERLKICAECHASDGTFPPTDPQFVRFQSSTFPNSPCVIASKGQFDCMTCHDPHRDAETSPAFYERKCLECHAPDPHSPTTDFARVPCPVNPSRDCLSCHMPRIEEVVPHTSFTDHHIRIRTGEDRR